MKKFNIHDWQSKQRLNEQSFDSRLANKMEYV